MRLRDLLRVDASSPHNRFHPFFAFHRLSTLIFTLLLATAAAGTEVDLAWSAVNDSRVDFYEIHWGTRSGEYRSVLQTQSTHATIADLTEGETYYFAAKACDTTGTNCSAFSEELATTIEYAAPVASFTESKTSGVAPLTLTFDDSSQSTVDTYAWDFGDGNSSTAPTAVHTYQSPGTYTVSLTVTGPGGTATETKSALITVTDSASDPGIDPDDGSDDGSGSNSGDDPTIVDSELPIEAGEVAVDHEWKRVEFAQTFTDPVVVVASVSGFGDDPVTVRIDAVDQTGFSVRLQEWEYLDDWHITETVGYLVVERGSHQLANGTWLEADTIPVGSGEAWQAGYFLAPFATNPVVLSTVATYNDASAVTTRLQGITSTEFDVALHGAENNSIPHAREIVAYVAWEPSCGEINRLYFAVAKTQDEITDAPTQIAFANQCADLANGFNTAPFFLADMQTTDGSDTANLRWDNKTTASVELWVDEEQSKDDETAHTTEVGGYIAIGEATAPAPLAAEVGEAEVGDSWQRSDVTQQFVDPIVIAKPMTSLESGARQHQDQRPRPLQLLPARPRMGSP